MSDAIGPQEAYRLNTNYQPDAATAQAIRQATPIDAANPGEPTATPGWLDRLGASSYSALNEGLMGLPDWVLKNVSPEAHDVAQQMLARNPLQSTVGGIAGDVASMLIPVGGEYKAASKLLGGAKTGAGRLLQKAATAATTPGGGLLKGAARGLLQAAPQIGIRTATGNITPEQAKTGALFAGGLGALGGVLGKAAAAVSKPEATGPVGKLANAIRNMSDQTIIKTMGGNKSMLRSVGSWGLAPKQVMGRAGRMKNLVHDTADMLASVNPKNDAEILDMINTGKAPFKAIDQAWEGMGKNLGDYRDSILELPAVRKYLGTLSKKADVNIPENYLEKMSHVNATSPDDIMAALKGIHGAEEGANAANELRLQNIDNLINTADREGGLSGITNYLNNEFIAGRIPPGAGHKEATELRDAAIQIKQLAQKIGTDSALAAGTLTPEQAAVFQKNYPSIKLLERMYESNQGNLFGAALGSDTAAKTLTGNILGGGLGPIGVGALGGFAVGGPQEDMGTRLRNAAIGAAIGVGGGSLLNQAATRGINKVLSKGAIGLKKSGILGKLGAAGGEAGSGAATPALSKAAQESALGAKYLGGQLPQMAQGEKPEAVSGATGIPPVDPQKVTIKDLMESDSPYLRSVGAALHGLWASGPALQGVSLDALTRAAAEQTDGFKNVPRVAQSVFYPQNPQEAQQFMQSYNMAAILNNVDFKKLIDTVKPMYLGGQGFLKAAPWNRQAEDQLNQLAEVAGVDPKMVVGDIQRIASIPNLSDAQKENMIKKRFMDVYAQHTGRNLYNMQALGLFNAGQNNEQKP